jgi:hypothetical protein
MKRAVLAASFAIVILGCGLDPKERGKLSILQREIFTPTCALGGCHSGASPQAGLDLTDGNAHASLVNVDSTLELGKKRVVPGDPAASVLFQAVQGTAAGVLRMPIGRSPLSRADVDAIAEWILAGARDD